MDIRQFVSTKRYSLLIGLQEAMRRREIEMELQMKELRQAPVQLQPAAKRFKAADVRSRSQRGHTCGKCSKVHEGPCRSSAGCHKCGRDGHFAKDCH